MLACAIRPPVSSSATLLTQRVSLTWRILRRTSSPMFRRILTAFACLHFAGSPLYQTNKTKSRIAKTQLLFRDRNLFMNILALEIQSHIKKADRMGLKPSIRLNGTSDIVWEKKAFF